MKLDVPFYSQNKDLVDLSWEKKACGIASVKMVLEYVNKDTDKLSLDELISEGVFLGGYTKDGWIHDVLVVMMRNHGACAYRQEFRSRVIDLKNKVSTVNEFEKYLANSGIEKLRNEILKGRPVITSVLGGFREGGKYHMIVLTGLEIKKKEVSGFYFHEPAEYSIQSGSHQFVEIDTFKKYWRKFAIFIE